MEHVRGAAVREDSRTQANYSVSTATANEGMPTLSTQTLEAYETPFKSTLARKQFWPMQEETFPLFHCCLQAMAIPRRSLLQ